MKIKELIRELNKHDKNSNVVWADHDHAENEYNNDVRYVDEACDELQEKGIGVVLHP